MQAGVRAAIAYIAGRMIAGGTRGSLYDFSTSQFTHFSGSVGVSSVNIYDHSRRGHLTSSGGAGRKISLYDHTSSSHIDLQIEGTKFKGYDFGSSSHYDGSVTGNNITMYDFGTGQFYQYSLS